jgi:AraC-like DNA-binding protein
MYTESFWSNAPQVTVTDCNGIDLDGWDSSNRSSPWWRIYWNDRTGARVELDGRRVELKPALMVLIPPYTPFSSVLAWPVKHHLIHFVASAPYSIIRPQFVTFAATRERVAVMRRLWNFPAASDLQKAQILISVLHVCYFALSLIPSEELTTFYTDHRVRSAVAWMEKHLGQPISNRTLADLVGMHPSAFVRLFRECSGRTPQAYLRVKRIDRASLLLNTSKASIDEIAMLSGFCDRYHLSRVFQRHHGMGPATYRRRHR